MLRLKQKGMSFCLALILLFGICPPAAAASEEKTGEAVAVSAEYMLNKVRTPQVGSAGGEWAVIGLARSGCDVPQEYWNGYYAAVEEYVESRKGVLHTKKYTE